MKIAKYLKDAFGIDDLSIEMAAGTPMLFGRVDWSVAKLPIAAVSGGLNRLAPMLFAVANHPKGAIFIDEIEDGFYYRKMESIWSMLLGLAESYESQVFASTHSLECIQAAANVARSDPGKFSFIRVIKKENKSVLHEFSGSDFATTLEAGFDPRSA
jgi:ABC-type multidrug transport system ATPase subunit